MKNVQEIHVTRSSMPPYEEFVEMIKPLWDSHWITNMGIYHQELERQLIEYLKVPNLSLFTNGHLALETVLQAMNLKGEVITTPFTFASTTHAIVRNGLKPVFCDIDEKTYTIDTKMLEDLITEQTTAILPVHVYGNVCNLEEIERIAQKHQLKVIYDAAHAFGVEYKGRGIGSFGDASMFSFHATKVYNTIEGGAITFLDSVLGERLYQLKNFGIKNEETVDAIGSNAKMNEFQAIMGLCNLKYFEEENKKRKIVTEKYREYLSEIEGIELCALQKDVKYNYSYFPIRIEPKLLGFTRDDLIENLKMNGIYTRKYFYPLVNAFDCYKDSFDVAETPIAMRISNQVLTLPLYSELELDSVEQICTLIKQLRNSKNT